MSEPAHEKPHFDEYASEYDSALAQGISVSGESKDYFAQGRVAWLSSCLKKIGTQPASILDFGCGTGTNVPFLLGLTGVTALLGVDVSAESLEVAQKATSDARARFAELDRFRPEGNHDMVFTNGVFHHIPPPERDDAISYIYRSLKPGGLFAFWENNPWNPGTRYVMSKIPFDRDAITLSALEAQRLARRGGFRVIRTDFLFIFPRSLGWLRKLEPALARLPLGAQYQVLCQKPR